MAPSNLQHRRTHNLLLISKLLNQRDGISPFTLILDGLEQSSRPLLAEYMARAPAAKSDVIFVSFETLRKPANVDVFIEAWDQNLHTWQTHVKTYVKTRQAQKILIVIDSLNSLSATQHGNLPAILFGLIGPSTNLLAVYHTDTPLSSTRGSRLDDYSPSPLTVLHYTATTVFTAVSFPHELARKSARERSLAEPSFGLQEGTDGVLQSLGANAGTGMVLEMEHRRKSGRGVRETYFLPARSDALPDKSGTKTRETVTLLEDHPLYRSQLHSDNDPVDAGEDTTFELGLTERQRLDREAVVLPYHDAQRGSGEGGRILYDMGEEDDFDEEEDEI